MIGSRLILPRFIEDLAELLDLGLVVDLMPVQLGLEFVELLRIGPLADDRLLVVGLEALQYLLAFMPLSDLADYDADFFLANTDLALRSRKEAFWGKYIPDDIF